MRMNLKTAALFLIPVVVIGPVACSTATEEQQIEDTVTSEMPLSQACGSCAETALATTCKDELETCVNTPDCLDVSGCMDGCAANDVGCFADCAAASAPFGALIDCVLCTECAGECSNDWTCGGGQPTDPGVPPTAEACVECILDDSTAECHDLAEACIASDECVQTAQCVASCGLTDDCAMQCAGNVTQETLALLEGLYGCATTAPCKEVCVGDPGQDPPQDPTDPADCNACAESAINSTCAQATEACVQTDGCAQIVECLSQCQDMSCPDACAANQTDAAWEVAKGLLSCVLCDACVGQCGQDTCNAI